MPAMACQLPHNIEQMNATITTIDRFASLGVWSRGSERAPHKPLLLLLALGLFSQGIRALPYVQYEQKIIDLLREFGPSRRSLHPEYPFWRLRNDGVWEVEAQGEMRTRASNNDIPRTELRSAHASGHFPADLQAIFTRQPRRVAEVAQLLLVAHFPESLHQDILDAVGLQINRSSALLRRRDPNFRNAVLLAYQYRCAVCGLDLRIGNISIGLEAAHIKWHQANGPDSVENGIALCSMHHKLFDLGTFTFEVNRQVLVSEQVHGTDQFEQVLLRHHGQQMNAPVRLEQHPFPEFIEWHRAEVFKAHPRPTRTS
jgi:putative restriction endonuclease